MVSHSIRPDFADRFLLPYHHALELSDEGRAFDPAEVVAFAPEERFTEFSFATEHVGNDAAISSLLSIRGALNRCSELFGYLSDPYEKWIDAELGRLWRRRGPFPGLGAVLCATGVTMGNFIAQALIDKVGENENPWPAWFESLKDPAKKLPTELARHIDSTIAKSWQRMNVERRGFLELLSRMDLTGEQAATLVTPEGRQEHDIALSDAEISANPYLIYEATRLTAAPVAVGVVDRGMFPSAMVREKFPLAEPSLVKTAVDARRLRALSIRNLETAAANGDTLRSRDQVIRDLRGRAFDVDEQKTPLTADLLAVAEDELFEGEIRIVKMADERPAYQLERLSVAGDLIRKTVEKRVESKRLALNIDWRTALDEYLKKNKFTLPDDPQEREREEAARQEKTAALEELAASRFSVLIGRAGTGKTTLLSVFCAQPQISKEGVLLLAPTGKARVRMEDIALRAGIKDSQAYTLAQHLSGSNRYDWTTQRYLMTGERGDSVAKTVIVDECSMLTEEMMAALIESLSKVDRLIFVGDYRQLPPIGAGRPFIDIVTRLMPEKFQENLGFDPTQEEWQAFGLSLGGSIWNDSVWFNTMYKGKPGSGVAAEQWQILSPVRQKPWGVETLNRFIHLHYKERQIELAQNPGRYRSIPSPKGEQQIIYGDKVINVRNWRVSKKRMFPMPEAAGYLANGEIGMVVGHRKTKARNWTPKHLEVEFSTQRGTSFTFYNSDFKEDGDSGLELAYALTVHKAQGSEFNKVFLVLPRSPLMVTRELLYTALTRQKEKVVVLLQGSATDLHRFSSERYSAAACRLTNLFGPPKPIEIKGAFLEERLIHNTEREDLVRSKSEVIIANLLFAHKLDYYYEQELVIDGMPADKFPDFTIEDDDADVTYYWEHLGMLGEPSYKRRWESKAQWYRENGILPYEDGGGPNGTLIVTRDDPYGGIDSAYISKLIKKVFQV